MKSRADQMLVAARAAGTVALAGYMKVYDPAFERVRREVGGMGDLRFLQIHHYHTDNSHHRYDVLLLINGVAVAQIELKTLGINPRRAIEQIVEYKNDPGNGYTRTLLGFVHLFIVSNYTDTWYFANNNARHFSFNADERFLRRY